MAIQKLVKPDSMRRRAKKNFPKRAALSCEKGVIINMEENKKNSGKRDFIEKHPLLAAIFLSALGGALMAIITVAGMGGTNYEFSEILALFGAVLVWTVIFGGFIIFPFVLTGAELFLLVKGRKSRELHRKGLIFDVVGVVLGILYSLIYMSFDDVMFGSNWQEQLVNNQSHTPIYTEARLTVIAIALVGAAGYLVVNFMPLKKVPPLTMVLGMAAMYLGTIESVVWGIQVLSFFLLLLPLNCLLITARTVGHKMWEWGQMTERDVQSERYQEGILGACNCFLMRAERWPLAAFFLMWPLLGIVIGILVLFGQRPDAVIKAFTETSDWNLSQRVAPQNIYYDEHYLCTVAAGGHEKIVKPKRLGVRHGHQVIVNRQLCVANAFEQVLEERTPRFHRTVRHFYDTYGFPAARLIHSKYTADLIYFLMKPLEWIFLIILYLVDADPESRIAIQYTGKSLADFGKGQRAGEKNL